MLITATQMIIDYFVDFDLIRTSLKILALLSLDSVLKNF